MGFWETSYPALAVPALDTGGPQPLLARLAEVGLLAGRVLDTGR